MTEAEIAWLSGIIEGEGSFCSKTSLAIQVVMTDKDVIERMQMITGLGRIYVVRPRAEHHKPAWMWSVQRRAHIRLIINAILPWLGSRRTIAANKLLNRVAHVKDRAA
jgi:hypothetical protein